MTRAQTPSVILRDVTEDDLPTLFEHQHDDVANRMAAFPARSWTAFVEHWRTNVLGKPTTRAIMVDGVLTGHIVSWEQDGMRFVGYWLGQTHWGRGIATAALTQFLEHDRARPLYASVAAHNLGSIRVLEKCGFRNADPGEDTPVENADGVPEHLFVLET